MRRLYSSLFEKNEIKESKIFEDAGGGPGCGTCMQGGGGSPEDGQYVQSIGLQRRKINDSVKKRKIYVTEEQAQMLEEMGTLDAGNYQYDVPMNFNGGNDPAYDHQNMMAKSFPKKKIGIRKKGK